MENSEKESNEEVDFSNAAENHKVGAKLADKDGNVDKGQHPRTAGQDGIPNTSPDTPNYGTFGVATASPIDQTSAGNNPGGLAAPSTPDPDQRGGVAQNQNTLDVLDHKEDDYDSRRESYRRDDPRYGGATSNWPTNEPANPTKDGPDPNEDNL